jgi:uncharacterized protein YjiS (DUF1127 family)
MNTHNPGIARPGTGRESHGLRRIVLRAGTMVAVWLERGRQRRALRQLSDHMLKDLGLSRSDAERESSKPFWRT